MKKEQVLVTGAAGFIGFHMSKRLLEKGIDVIGYDNLNDYYDVKLKESRLAILKTYPNFKFLLGSLEDRTSLETIFKEDKPTIVINLAAQAGVRYSIENPQAYIDSNINGFFNILEMCKLYDVQHLLFASSSSVYGNQEKVPFSTEDNVDKPISLYAATKKSNELMAYTYSHLYKFRVTGLRFFTVYGPFGRPDMAYFSFVEKIMKNKKIKIFNNGELQRDFTYIDDIIDGMDSIIFSEGKNSDLYKIYNIGNNKPESLLTFVNNLEELTGKKAIKTYYPMQPGDVYRTYADITDMYNDFGFEPKTSLYDGLKKFVLWYKEYNELI